MTRRLGASALVAAAGLTLVGPLAPAHARPVPPISAPSAIVMEVSTGDVAFARNANERRAIASTTKMMTALVARERLDLNDTVRAVPYAALPVESKIDLRAGEAMTVADLLRALLLASANDAAATLAARAGGSRPAFVRQMNERARALGLRDTRFANPIGLDDPNNYSTARDLVLLARELRKDRFLRETVARGQAILRSGARVRTVLNRNALVRAGQADGVKTGHTRRAGYLLVGSRQRSGITVISAVLGASSEAARDADSRALLTWALDEYRSERVLDRGVAVTNVPLRHRGEKVAVVAQRPVSRVVRTNQRLRVTVRGVPSEVDGPLARGTQVGTAVVTLDGAKVATVPLTLADDVAAAGFLRETRAWLLGHWLLIFGALGFVGCTLWVRRYRRLAAQRRVAEAERRRERREQAHAALDEHSPFA